MSENQNTNNRNANLFGDFLRQQLQSIFSPQTREQSQQFSSQPAADSIQAQTQANTNDLAQQLNLQAIAARNTAGLNEQVAQTSNQRQLEQARAARNAGSRGSGSSTQGPGSFFSGQRIIATTGQTLAPTSSDLGMWNAQRDQALQSTSLFGRANADVDIYRNNAIADNQTRNAREIAEVNRYNQERLGAANLSGQMQLNTQQAANQAALQREQLASQERTAQIAAQGNILGSLFGSVGAGSPNYRYWN